LIDELNSSSTALVGRDAEYETIERATRSLEAGVGGVVLVEGVAGIGKSALLGECRRYVEGRRVRTLVGTSASPDRDRPFGAIFDALGCTPDSDDSQRRALRELTSVQGLAAPWEREGSIVRFAVQDALVNLVEHELSVGPAVLILDDVQWADAASLGAVAAITSLARSSPLLVVLAMRPVPRLAELAELLRDLRPVSTLVQLAPLSEADSLELIKQRGLGRTLPFPVGRLGGNPFLLVSAIGTTEWASVHRNPEAEIRWAILGRLEGLTSPTIEVLRVAAGFGGTFDVDDLTLVHAASGLDVLTALDEASRAGVIVAAGPRLTFVHDLVREAMLDELSEPLRRGLHRAIWRAMALAGRAASSFANHIVRTAMPGDREAVAELRRAGIELAETDPSRASAYLGHAAELALPLPWAERGDVAADRAEVLRLAGRLADVVAVVEEAVEWPVSAEQLARLEYTGAAALRFLGRVPEATTNLRRAISRQAMPADMTSWAWSLIAGSEVFSLASPADLKVAIDEARRLAELSSDRAALVQSWCGSPADSMRRSTRPRSQPSSDPRSAMSPGPRRPWRTR
jgi:hypothetical protein